MKSRDISSLLGAHLAIPKHKDCVLYSDLPLVAAKAACYDAIWCGGDEVGGSMA